MKQSRIALDYKPAAKPTASAPHHGGRWLIAGLMLPLVGGLLAFTLSKDPAPASVATLPLAELTPDLLRLDLEETLSLVPAPLAETVEFTVRRNDTLDRIFRQLNLDLQDLANLRLVPGVRESVDRLRPGDLLTLVHQDGLLQSFSRRISETEILTITRTPEGFAAQKVATPVEIRTAQAHGTIDSSLFVAARAAGVSPELILRLANDIFGWSIDFALDIRSGDRFSLVYEQKYRDGEYIGDGRILAAEFSNAGTVHRAVHFASGDGKVSDYFAPDGRSMRRQFLRAPLDFTRISSNFNPRRMHPILNSIRAHRGVDYAAPTGTLIKAAGDGRVQFVGVKGGYGRVVVLEHGGGITTLYGHMSRFAGGLRQGQRVKQGNTIGYVGSTGAATGPHLHYEYRINGVHKNPRTVQLPQAEPIPAQYLTEFQTRSGTLFTALDRARDAAFAALPASQGERIADGG